MEEVEAGLKGLKVNQAGKPGPPLMAEQMEESLSMVDSHPLKKDGDMSAFNKLVSTMKASGTLPSQPKVNVSTACLIVLGAGATAWGRANYPFVVPRLGPCSILK